MEKKAFTVTTSISEVYQVVYQIESNGFGTFITAYVYNTYALYENEEFQYYVYAENTDIPISDLNTPVEHSFAIKLYNLGVNQLMSNIEFVTNTYTYEYIVLIANEIVPFVIENINRKVLQCK